MYARQELVKKEDEITYGLSEEDEIETINGMGVVDTVARQQLNNIANEKVDKVNGKGLSTNDYTTAEKQKLEGLSNYVHPSTHDASIINQDSTHRFVTDEEKVKWNSNTGIDITDEQISNAVNSYITENGLTFSFALTDANYKGYVTSDNVVTNNPVVSDYTDYKIIPKGETVEFTGKLGNTNSLVLIPITPITTETRDKMYFDNNYYIRPYVYNSSILITKLQTNYDLATNNANGTNIKACCFDTKPRYYCDNNVISTGYSTSYLKTNTYSITYFRNSTSTNYVAISYSRAITDDEFTSLVNQFGGVA